MMVAVLALAREAVVATAPEAAAMAPEAEAPQPVRARELEDTVLPRGIP
jgi:hypothetical protein